MCRTQSIRKRVTCWNLAEAVCLCNVGAYWSLRSGSHDTSELVQVQIETVDRQKYIRSDVTAKRDASGSFLVFGAFSVGQAASRTLTPTLHAASSAGDADNVFSFPRFGAQPSRRSCVDQHQQMHSY